MLNKNIYLIARNRQVNKQKYGILKFTQLRESSNAYTQTRKFTYNNLVLLLFLFGVLVGSGAVLVRQR